MVAQTDFVFPKLRGGFGGSCEKVCGILWSVLGSPHLGKPSLLWKWRAGLGCISRLIELGTNLIDEFVQRAFCATSRCLVSILLEPGSAFHIQR